MSFAVAQYQRNEFQTVSPAKIIVAFYDGAIRFMRKGADALNSKNFALKGTYLSKAHAVVSELRATLDPTHSKELCEELDRLYAFVLDCITEANVQADSSRLIPAISVLEELRSAWASVAEPAVRLVGAP